MSEKSQDPKNEELVERIADAVVERLKDDLVLDRIADVILDETRLHRAMATARSESHALTHQLEDTHEWLRKAFLNTEILIDLLKDGSPDLRERIDQQLRSRIIQLSEDPATWSGLGIRLNPREPTGKEEEKGDVDCLERLPICQGACCYMNFSLTWEEVKAGIIQWDQKRPFSILHAEDGYCVHWDREAHLCTTRGDRPLVCRGYTCRNDKRIWEDFEAKKLSVEYMERLRCLAAGIPFHPGKKTQNQD